MVEYGYLLPTRGVVLASDDPEELASRVRSEVIGLAETAERRGFDGVWAGDSVLAKPKLEPLSVLSGVAVATESIRLGTSIYIPTLRHAINVAHQATTVAQLSGGRLSLGVGIGIGADSEAEYATLGISFDSRASRLDETLDVLEQAFAGDPVTVDGNHYAIDGADIGFQPPVEPNIYVASAAFNPADGFPRSIERRLLAHGDGWLPVGLSPDSYAAGTARLDDLLREGGRDPSGFTDACYVDAVVAETEDEALGEARAFLEQYYSRAFLDRFQDGLPDEKIRARGAFGSPETVATELQEYVDAGVEEFVIRFLSTDQRSQQERFAEAVLA